MSENATGQIENFLVLHDGYNRQREALEATMRTLEDLLKDLEKSKIINPHGVSIEDVRNELETMTLDGLR